MKLLSSTFSLLHSALRFLASLWMIVLCLVLLCEPERLVWALANLVTVLVLRWAVKVALVRCRAAVIFRR